jgi:hypothetical protein
MSQDKEQVINKVLLELPQLFQDLAAQLTPPGGGEAKAANEMRTFQISAQARIDNLKSLVVRMVSVHRPTTPPSLQGLTIADPTELDECMCRERARILNAPVPALPLRPTQCGGPDCKREHKRRQYEAAKHGVEGRK